MTRVWLCQRTAADAQQYQCSVDVPSPVEPSLAKCVLPGVTCLLLLFRVHLFLIFDTLVATLDALQWQTTMLRVSRVARDARRPDKAGATWASNWLQRFAAAGKSGPAVDAPPLRTGASFSQPYQNPDAAAGAVGKDRTRVLSKAPDDLRAWLVVVGLTTAQLAFAYVDYKNHVTYNVEMQKARDAHYGREHGAVDLDPENEQLGTSSIDPDYEERAYTLGLPVPGTMMLDEQSGFKRDFEGNLVGPPDAEVKRRLANVKLPQAVTAEAQKLLEMEEQRKARKEAHRANRGIPSPW